MAEFRSKWLDYPETSKNPTDKTDRSPFVRSVSPQNMDSGAKNLCDRLEEVSNTPEWRRALRFLVRDLTEAMKADAVNDKQGITERTGRMLNSLHHLGGVYRRQSDVEALMAMKAAYCLLDHRERQPILPCESCEGEW